jgi:hypothetical protein
MELASPQRTHRQPSLRRVPPGCLRTRTSRVDSEEWRSLFPERRRTCTLGQDATEAFGRTSIARQVTYRKQVVKSANRLTSRFAGRPLFGRYFADVMWIDR